LKWVPTLWYFLCGLNIILLILKIFPVFDQQNWLSISLILPLNLAMAFSWGKVIKKLNPSLVPFKISSGGLLFP
jgi:hypothetical protein